MVRRIEREFESRDSTRREEMYAPPSTLPDPAPEPGWVHRWVATHVLNAPETRNVSMKLREGWEPVKAEDHPEMAHLASPSGNIEVGGLMLCRAPAEKMKARDRYYERQASAQITSVDNTFLRENDPRMPLFRDRKSKVTFGSGE